MQTVAFAMAAISTLALASAQDFSGQMTTYEMGKPAVANCGFLATGEGATTNYAAINGAQWAGNANCGRCALVSCADSRCKDQKKTELVYILDQCPECKKGDLDVSPSVFKSLTGSNPSKFKISWKFTNCPVKGNLQYCLKSGSNASIASIQPANSVVGIKSMTINSKAATMLPTAFFYRLENANVDYKAVQVSVTSISGETITDTVELKEGACTPGKSQFAASRSLDPERDSLDPEPATQPGGEARSAVDDETSDTSPSAEAEWMAPTPAPILDPTPGGLNPSMPRANDNEEEARSYSFADAEAGENARAETAPMEE